ncbi:MAG: 50S ribosomal protein L18 [Patescibacteria group bacterium]
MLNRIRNHHKIRKTVIGTTIRPRLAVFRSLNNLTAQLIDDSAGRTLASANSLKEKGNLTDKAKFVGEKIAEEAKVAKIKTVVFDRGGYTYQGVVKILAETARKGGLEF